MINSFLRFRSSTIEPFYDVVNQSHQWEAEILLHPCSTSTTNSSWHELIVDQINPAKIECTLFNMLLPKTLKWNRVWREYNLSAWNVHQHHLQFSTFLECLMHTPSLFNPVNTCIWQGCFDKVCILCKAWLKFDESRGYCYSVQTDITIR